MNKTLIAYIVAAFLVTGCAERQIKLVEVDKPIPLCPKPPVVPALVSKVDLLTPADAANPGKVGEAYKYDMTFLRTTAGMYQLILKEYDKTSQNFDAVTVEINKSFKEIDSKITDAQKPAGQ